MSTTVPHSVLVSKIDKDIEEAIARKLPATLRQLTKILRDYRGIKFFVRGEAVAGDGDASGCLTAHRQTKAVKAKVSEVASQVGERINQLLASEK